MGRVKQIKLKKPLKAKGGNKVEKPGGKSKARRGRKLRLIKKLKQESGELKKASLATEPDQKPPTLTVDFAAKKEKLEKSDPKKSKSALKKKATALSKLTVQVKTLEKKIKGDGDLSSSHKKRNRKKRNNAMPTTPVQDLVVEEPNKSGAKNTGNKKSGGGVKGTKLVNRTRKNKQKQKLKAALAASGGANAVQSGRKKGKSSPIPNKKAKKGKAVKK